VTIQCWWSRQGFDRVSVDHAASKVDVRALHPRIHYVCGRHTGGAWHQSPGTVYQSLSAAGGASSKGGPSHTDAHALARQVAVVVAAVYPAACRACERRRRKTRMRRTQLAHARQRIL